MYKSAADKAKAKSNFIHADHLDPAYQCASPGVARVGKSEEIVATGAARYLMHTPKTVIGSFLPMAGHTIRHWRYA